MQAPDRAVAAAPAAGAAAAGADGELLEQDGQSRAAAKQLDFVACTFDQLTPDQRGSLAQVVQQLAAAEPSAERRESLDAFAEDFGLTDDAERSGSTRCQETQITRSQTPTSINPLSRLAGPSRKRYGEPQG